MTPFNDITLYAHSPYSIGHEQYYIDTALMNYVSDLYIRHMNGYKPPNTTRVTIEAAPVKRWERTWRNGSLRTIAAEFHYDHFSALDTLGRYRYILDIIQKCMLQLCDEYEWNKSVFERAYGEVLEQNFKFKILYPIKLSPDRIKKGALELRKTDNLTTLLGIITLPQEEKEVVLISKKNWWWYDSTYLLVKDYKWFDRNRFGVECKKAKFKMWYNVLQDKIGYEINGIEEQDYNIQEVFQF